MVQIAPTLLAPGGRFAAICFHSLEDRAVKTHFEALVQGGQYRYPPSVLPKGSKGGVLQASEGEMEANPRARSAKLRVIERLA